MKKSFAIALSVIICLSLSACAGECKHTVEIGRCPQCDEIINSEELDKIITLTTNIDSILIEYSALCDVYYDDPYNNYNVRMEQIKQLKKEWTELSDIVSKYPVAFDEALRTDMQDIYEYYVLALSTTIDTDYTYIFYEEILKLSQETNNIIALKANDFKR